MNDQRADIYNRERWQVAQVDAKEHRVVLDGIDQAKRVEVGAEYLAQTNPYSGAPSLEHAYAVTTYSAQGSTVDRAFVAADPSMDKQELYVAASRSREETRLYATPEVQTHREEFAPRSALLREGIPHIAEASERDRAQLAAHEVALRSRFSGLPTEEPLTRHGELRGAAGNELVAQERRDGLMRRIEEGYEALESDRDRREAIEALPRRELKRRQDELSRIESSGVTDQRNAFGKEAQRGAERARQEQAQRRLLQTQRALGLGQHAARVRDLGRGMGER